MQHQFSEVIEKLKTSETAAKLQNFFCALDTLGSKSDDLFQQGVQMTLEFQAALVDETNNLIENNELYLYKHFRYGMLNMKVFNKRNSLTSLKAYKKLALLLMDIQKGCKQSNKSVILINQLGELFIVIGVVGGMSFSGQQKNQFGQYFLQKVRELNLQFRQNSFETSVIEIHKDDFPNLIDTITDFQKIDHILFIKQTYQLKHFSTFQKLPYQIIFLQFKQKCKRSMDRPSANVRSSITFLSNNDQEQREKIQIQLIPALQSFQTFIKMNNESQMAQIVDSLMAIDFFKKSCPEGSSLRDFIMYAGKALTYEYYKKGQIIFHYGDYGDKFFMILKGNVGVLVPKGNHDIDQDRDFLLETNRTEPWSNVWKGKKSQNTIDVELLLAQGEDPWLISNRYFEGGVCLYQKIYSYYGGQTFGDVSLYTDKPRTASILVLSEDIHVITMNKTEYKQICEKSLQDMNSNVDYFMRMLPNNSKFVITKFMQYMHKIEFAPQSILWKEGEESKFFMLIYKGRVELIKKIGKVRITLCQLSDNGWVGQEEIFDQQLRQSTCQCADNTVAYYIQIEEFNQIRRNFPEICKVLKEKSQMLKEYMKIRYEMIMNNFINKPELIEKQQQKVERKTISEIFHTSIKTKSQDIRSHSPKALRIIGITECNNKINQSRGGFRNLNIFPMDKDSVLLIRDRVSRQLTKQKKKKEKVQPQTMREGTLLSSTISDVFKQNDQIQQHSSFKSNDLKKGSFTFVNIFAQGSTNIPNSSNDHFTSRLTTQQSYFRMKTEQGRSQIQTQTSFDQKQDSSVNFRNNSTEINKLRSNSPLNSMQFLDRHQNTRIHSCKMIARPKKRNKTNPDQHQLLSMSSQSSSRNSAVKATLKVYSEMKEDQGCKLAMRFTQLKIVLATHKILGFCHKIKSVRLQHYFDVLLLTKSQNTLSIPILNKPQQGQIQYLTPPTKKKSVKFQPKCSIAPCLILKSIINKHVLRCFKILQYNQNLKIRQNSFNNILFQLFKKKQTKNFFVLKTRLLQAKTFRRINFIINKKINIIQFEALLSILQYIQNTNIHSQQVSLLDSEFSQQQQMTQEPNHDIHEHEINNQLMSAKEQLAMKFASTSLLIGILSQVMIKAQFAFLLHLRSQQNQKQDVREVKSIDISENLDQSLIEEEKIKPKIIAANQIYHFLNQKLKQYFEQINEGPSRVTRPSIKIFKGEKKHKQQNQNLKLLILGQKIFKEDDPQQKSTDITVNEKKGSFKALPGVRYVTQYSDISKNAFSDSEVTEKSIITDCVNTLENIKTSVILKNQTNQTQQHRLNDKKEKLNSAIQQYLTPIKIQKNSSQKLSKIEQKAEKKFSKVQLLYFLPIIIIMFIVILMK